MEEIYKGIIYVIGLKSNNLLKLYYLIFWRIYLKKINIWDLDLTMQHYQNFFIIFYKDLPDKKLIILFVFEIILSITILTNRLIIKLAIKQKHSQIAQISGTNKYIKKN